MIMTSTLPRNSNVIDVIGNSLKFSLHSISAKKHTGIINFLKIWSEKVNFLDFVYNSNSMIWNWNYNTIQGVLEIYSVSAQVWYTKQKD